MDSKSLFLTANTGTVYLFGWLDLKDGPMVVETSPDILGIVDDHWFRYVADLGNAGPDKGKGGKYLFLPPGYKGEVPQGYFVYRSPTYGNWLVGRGFLVDGSPNTRSRASRRHGGSIHWQRRLIRPRPNSSMYPVSISTPFIRTIFNFTRM